MSTIVQPRPKQPIRVAIADIHEDLAHVILDFVRDRFDFVLTRERDAEFVLHSVDGMDVLKYPGVRIFWTGENVTPDFALSDYALGFEKLSFSDRYLWMPLIKLFHADYAVLKAPRPPVEEVFARKTDFCAYVMSNTSNSAEERERIFDLLTAYKKVNSGGGWRNNVGGRVADKREFQSRHKFVIAFENSSSRGYLTEKFAQAAAADAVPIYWGDPDIADLFNPKAFVNCHAFATLEDAVERVREIDQNDQLYRQMLAEPWFRDGVEPVALQDSTIADFLENIFSQEPSQAFRRNRSRWGKKREKNLCDAYHRPLVHNFKLLRTAWRKLMHKVLPRRRKY